MSEKFQEARNSAKRYAYLADHMLSVTYPLMKDARLLMAILENIFLAYTHGIAALLYYSVAFKEISEFPPTFESRLAAFRELAEKNNLDKNLALDISDIRNLLIERKKSPVEFSKNEKFIICSQGFETKSIGVSEINSYLNKAKLFILAIDNITSKNEGIFGRSKE